MNSAAPITAALGAIAALAAAEAAASAAVDPQADNDAALDLHLEAVDLAKQAGFLAAVMQLDSTIPAELGGDRWTAEAFQQGHAKALADLARAAALPGR